MARDKSLKNRRIGGLLTRLRRDVRANTLAMMAIALIPLSALAGSAIDMARLYVVKVRLQQACDAGALAGRKFLDVDASGTELDDEAAKQADAFFANNFHEGWLGTKAVEFDAVRTEEGRVAGTATATVPMTIMKMFNAGDKVLTVACEARYDLADTDVMFVLDTTGSMACRPEDSDCDFAKSTYTRDDGTTGYYDVLEPGSKLEALQGAVVDFDTTIRESIDENTTFRYGFVTYSSTVNVGGLIPQQYMISGEYDYQSRHIEMHFDTARNVSFSAASRSACEGRANTRVAQKDGGYIDIGDTSWVSTRYNTYCEADTVTRAYPFWHYERWPQDVTNYVKWQTVPDPTRTDGSTSSWQGCIEAAETEADTSFDINDLPADLDPDLIPSNDDERWKPMWPAVTWDRNDSSAKEVYVGDDQGPWWNPYESYASPSKLTNGFAPCGMPATLPEEMSAQDVSEYVHDNDFRALGGTYHDVGMIWGVRMLSRDGIFASHNQAPPGRDRPNQVIVFMTDGEMAPTSTAYGLYGIEAYDGRVTGSTLENDKANHTARFLAECKIALNRDIDIYVVALGTDITEDLNTCAGRTDRVFSASSKTELSDAFKQIAKRVAMLRVSE